MKKLLILVFILLIVLSSNVNAKTVTATIPDYSLTLENSSIYHFDSEYPLLSYKNVTYFPLTYDYLRALNLINAWDNEKGLFIAYQPSFNSPSQPLPIYQTTKNKKRNKVNVAEYPIYINGKLYDNQNADYPFLDFRNVTYCPMTWDLAYNEFGWTINFVPGKFSISADSTVATKYNFVQSMPDGFVVYSYVQVPTVLDNGVLAIVNKPYYEKFDYATQALIPYPEWNVAPIRQYVKHDIEIKDGLFYFKGNPIQGCAPLASISVINHSAYILEYTLADKIFYELNYSFTDTSYYSSKTDYTFVDVYGALNFIGQNIYIADAAKCADGNVYFNTNVKSRSFADSVVKSSVYKLYRLSPNGVITSVNDLYPQYGSMQLLGEVNGIMYLNCLHMPCYDNIARIVYEPSPVNDGYFTYNGQELVKIYNYVYADHSVLAPTGDIYGIFNRSGQIKKIN